MIAREMIDRDVSRRQVAAQLGVDESTLRYHLARDPDAPDGRRTRATALDGWDERIRAVLERFGDRRVSEQGTGECTSKVLFDVLVREYGRWVVDHDCYEYKGARLLDESGKPIDTLPPSPKGDLMPQTTKDIKQMCARLHELCGSIQNRHLAAIVQTYLDDDSLMSDFCKALDSVIEAVA